MRCTRWAILLALTAGTVLAGLAGALLAVPVTAMAWDALDHLRSRSPAYSEPEPPPAAARGTSDPETEAIPPG